MDTREDGAVATLEKIRAGTLVQDADAAAAGARFKAAVEAAVDAYLAWVPALLRLDRELKAAVSRHTKLLEPEYLAQAGTRSSESLAREWTTAADEQAVQEFPNLRDLLHGLAVKAPLEQAMERARQDVLLFADPGAALRALAECLERFEAATPLQTIPTTDYFKDEVVAEKVHGYAKVLEPSNLYGMCAESFESLRSDFLAASALLDSPSLDGPTRARAAGLPGPEAGEQPDAFEARVEEALAGLRAKRDALAPLLGGSGPGEWELFSMRARALSQSLEQERAEAARVAAEQARQEAEAQRRTEQARRAAAQQSRDEALLALARAGGFSILRIQLQVELPEASALQLSGPAFARLGAQPAVEAYTQSTLSRVELPCATLELAIPSAGAELRLSLLSSSGKPLAQDVVISTGPGVSSVALAFHPPHVEVQLGQSFARVGRITSAATALSARLGMPALGPALSVMLGLSCLALGLGAFVTAALHWTLVRAPASDLLVDAAPQQH